MKLVVTGTRRGRPDVAYWLDRWARRYGLPEVLIVGDADGVDAQAVMWCGETRPLLQRVVVNPLLASPHRYHDRNQRMVDAAEPGDHCLAFPDPESRGTWDCVRRARARGLRVFVLPLVDEEKLDAQAG